MNHLIEMPKYGDPYMVGRTVYLMADQLEKVSINQVRADNDRIIMKVFGLDYQKIFSQE